MTKTRSLGAKLAAGGHVRINSQRIDAPDKRLRIGDVLTIALERTVLVLEVTAFGERRGPASEARTLYRQVGDAADASPAEEA